MSSKRELKVAVVQMDSKVECIEENIAKAHRLTQDLQPGSVDLVCFPEMVLSGYSYPSLEAIRPFLETATDGPTSTFCRDLAMKLQCYVCAGYPEKVEDTNSPEKIARNSSIMYTPDGSVHNRYRKTNLYVSDLPWCQIGDGFHSFDLKFKENDQEQVVKTSVVICMDLNPNPISEAANPFKEPHEVADHCLTDGIRLLIAHCAWLDSGIDFEKSKWDTGTLAYWMHRLSPLCDPVEQDPASNGTKPTYALIVNRTGLDRGDIQYGGTSTLLKFERGKEQQPEVLGLFGRNEEGCKVWNIQL